MTRSSRGSAIVDLVLVLGLLLPLVLGVLQVALVAFVRNTLASAASEGARYAATAGRGPAHGVTRTREQLAGVLSERYAEGVRAREVTVAGAPGIEVTVHAEVPALGLGGPALSFDITGHAIREES